MNVADIISDLDDHGFEDTPEERKLAVINETVWDVGTREPWPQLITTATLTFNGTSNAPTNQPSDMVAVISVRYPDRAKALRPQRLDDIEEQYGYQLTSSGGSPQFYYFEGSAMKVYPLPSASQTFVLKYVKSTPELLATDLEAAIWIPRTFHRGLIVNGAAYKLYLLEDDPELSREFERLYEKAYSNMRNSLWMQQYDENDMIEWYLDDIDYD